MSTVAMNETELEEYMKKNPDLEKFRHKILVYKGVKGKEMWALMDETDKYSFQERMKCKKDGSKYSPSDYTRKKKVSLSVARAKMGECTLHPVPMILAVLELFKPKKWFDPTSGWGDRLRGALLANVPLYVGVDSNPGMVKPYEKIIKAYPDSTTKVQMISSRIQNVKLSNKLNIDIHSPSFFTDNLYKKATNLKVSDHFYKDVFKPFLNYIGVDNSHETVKPYENIVKAYPHSNTVVKLISPLIQNVKVPSKFDLVFTSPPFFTAEAYKGATDWKSLDHFYEEFFEPFLKVCYDHLMVNGHLVLYIEKADPVRMIDLIQQMFPSMKYEGIFYYAGETPRPYYVWKKESSHIWKKGSSHKTRKNRS